MDEKDSMTPDTIPQSTPVDGTVPAGRKNRRPVDIGWRLRQQRAGLRSKQRRIRLYR